MISKKNKTKILKKDADLAQIDESQLRRNLSLSFEQRLEAHQAALDLFWDLKEAGKKLRAESQ